MIRIKKLPRTERARGLPVDFAHTPTSCITDLLNIKSSTTSTCVQEYVGKAGDVLDNVFFVVTGRIEARVSKPGKQVTRRVCADVR